MFSPSSACQGQAYTHLHSAFAPSSIVHKDGRPPCSGGRLSGRRPVSGPKPTFLLAPVAAGAENPFRAPLHVWRLASQNSPKMSDLRPALLPAGRVM